MSSLSPVVEAFLTGQAQQQDAINKSKDWQLRKDQLDQIAKQFETTSKQAQQRIDLEKSAQDIQNKIHLTDLHHKIVEGIQNGAFTPQETTNFPMPGMQSVQPNVTPNIGAPPTVNGPPIISQGPSSNYQQLPQTGAPATVNIPGLGPQTVAMPRTNLQQVTDQANALLPITRKAKEMEADIDIKKYNATVGNTKELDMQNKLDMANAHNSMMETYYKNLMQSKDDATAMRETVARIQGENSANSALIKMGWGTPGMVQSNAVNYATLARTGLLDSDTEKMMTPAEKTAYKNTLTSSGSVRFDPKVRTQMDANLSSGASLLNDFAQLNNKYPAPIGTIGKIGNLLATRGPAGYITDIGQEFDRINANIANLAKQTGESPSMARSVALAKKAEAAQIKSTDNPSIRQEKYIKLGDLMLDVVQGGLQNLPTAQKIDIWKQEMAKPGVQMLIKNVKFMPVFENILKTGNYDPGLIGAGQK